MNVFLDLRLRWQHGQRFFPSFYMTVSWLPSMPWAPLMQVMALKLHRLGRTSFRCATIQLVHIEFEGQAMACRATPGRPWHPC